MTRRTSRAGTVRQKQAEFSSLSSAPDAVSARPVAELAGFRRRLASMLYESMLLLGVLALTFLVPYLILGAVASFTPPGWGLWLHVFVVLGVYFVWYWRRGGQTLAMQTWRLKIVDGADGRTASLGRCWLRYALAWPSVLLCGFGLLWALVDRDRQFLHDRLAGTCIVLLPVPPKS
jgi:uncharacterized RDD family membrane protein YckC